MKEQVKGGAGSARTIVGLLVKRLRLVDDRAKHPEIADEVVSAPLFVVGLPRTGSTQLHALMAQVEGVRTPRFWEMSVPSPPPERETFETAIPSPRLGSPRDIAAGCTHLASEDGEYVNGVLLPIDGGLTCKLGIPDTSALSAIGE